MSHDYLTSKIESLEKEVFFLRNKIEKTIQDVIYIEAFLKLYSSLPDEANFKPLFDRDNRHS